MPAFSAITDALEAIQHSKWAFDEELPRWQHLVTDYYAPGAEISSDQYHINCGARWPGIVRECPAGIANDRSDAMRVKSAISVATFAVFFAMIAVFVGYIASLGIRVSPPAKRTSLSLDVPDINNIAVDSRVLLRGVSVGRVTRIDTSVATATIHFYIDEQFQVPADSDVRLDNLSALGESYLEFEPRSSGGPVLRDGQHIAPDSVKQPPSISELGTSVVRVLNQLDPKQLSDLIGEATWDFQTRALCCLTWHVPAYYFVTPLPISKVKAGKCSTISRCCCRTPALSGPALAGAAPSVRDLGPGVNAVWNDVFRATLWILPTDVKLLSGFVQRIQKFLDDRGIDLRVLGEATSANVKLIANALKNFDSSQILANLLATVPEDGAIELHVAIPQR